ncbi:MAG TPA: cell wall-binding repeat-containing protein [Alphaproteobacteria bacterium]|nr:cell wall-binding repeat-containing protein [Alphaproteobacteria bacterium]
MIHLQQLQKKDGPCLIMRYWLMEKILDALAAAPLARKYCVPILLTESQNLTTITKQTLQDLKVKNVFIVGGNRLTPNSILLLSVFCK